MPATTDSWGADVPISMPMPKRNDYPTLAELGAGWAMTATGLIHDLDESTWEEVVTPTFAPLLIETTRFPNG
jgi:hypothetical protein